MAKQIYPDKGFAATFKFNGIIDGEPTCTVDPTTIGTSLDPKVEQPATDDPTKTETVCTLHGWTHDQEFRGFVNVTVVAVVDDPSTANNTEQITQEFPELVEYIAPTQAKATSISVDVVEETPPDVLDPRGKRR